MKQLRGSTVQDFNNGVANMEQMGANIANDILSGVQTAMSQLGSALTSIGSDAASGLAALGNLFSDAMGQLASGLGSMLSQIGQYMANSPLTDPETGAPINPFAPPIFSGRPIRECLVPTPPHRRAGAEARPARRATWAAETAALARWSWT